MFNKYGTIALVQKRWQRERKEIKKALKNLKDGKVDEVSGL